MQLLQIISMNYKKHFFLTCSFFICLVYIYFDYYEYYLNYTWFIMHRNNFQGHRGVQHFIFTKTMIGFFTKFFSITYKPVFIEFKNLFKFWDIVIFVKSFLYKLWTANFSQSISWKFQNSLKIHLLLHFFELFTSYLQETFLL